MWVLLPSSQQISVMTPRSFAWVTTFVVISRICFWVFASFLWMCSLLVGMIMLTLSTPASMAMSMSLMTLLVALQISVLSPCWLMSFTACLSPGLTAANPASMTFTPSVSSVIAISSFFSGVRLIPGVCSPSRRVVSKNCTCFGYLVNKAIPHYVSRIFLLLVL